MTEWSQGEIDQVRNGISKTVEELQKANGTDEALLEAFNRISRQLETLTQEIRALREDIHPPMDKPGRKLPPKRDP